MESIKKTINKSFLVSIMVFLVGLILFLKLDTTIKTITIIIGIFLIVIGSGLVIELLKSEEKRLSFKIAPSIILFVIAFILFFTPEILVSIIPLFIGIALVMSSSFKLQNIYNIKRLNNTFNIWTLVIAIAILILGLLFIVNPFGGAIAITKVIGIVLMIYSILDVADNIILRKIIK